MPNPALSYHPVPLGHPSNGGELSPQREHNKFPSAEGWHYTGPHENAIFVGGCAGVVYHPKPWRRVIYHPKPWRRMIYHPKPRRRVTRVTFLSLRRSTINVENVVVRLRQSSAICLRANARSAFLFTGSPRSFHSLAMTKGTKCLILHSLTTRSLGEG